MPTILDRVRPAARDLTRDATHSLIATGDAIAERADDVTAAVSSAAETIADRTADSVAQVGDRIAEVAADVDDTLRAAKERLTRGASLDDVVRQLERRWPGTDTGRYDRAFERGYARGRSGRLAIGLAAGAAAAGAGVYFLDPERGTARREALMSRVRRVIDDRRQAMSDQRAMANAGQGGEGIAVGPGREPLESDPWVAPAEPDLRTPVAAGAVAAEGPDAERGDWHRDLEG